MRVCDYIARRLASEGITHAFLVQGAANNDLIYSIADTPGIQYVCAQHEQAAGFMAEGYAKASGKPGLAIGTSGPGGQNLVTAIANCFYDSVPCIFITGQVNSGFMRRDHSMRQLGFQEWPASEVLAPITKYCKLVLQPNDVVHELETAIHGCQTGRPGPVLLDIPIDVQRGEISPQMDIAVHQHTKVSSHFIPLSADQLKLQGQVINLVEDLQRAQRPVLLIGGGVRGERAQEALDTLAALLRIPIFPTWNALDVVTSDHPWYGGRVGTYGGPGRNFAIQNSDLLIAVGCRISGRITGGRPETFARGAKKCVVDIDRGLLDSRNQEVKTDVSIWSDAETFLRDLERQWRYATVSEAKRPDRLVWVEQVVKWREQYGSVPAPAKNGVVDFNAFAEALSELAPSNAIIVYDCGGNAVVMNHSFKTKRGQRYFSNNGNSPMGFAFASAIGAWFAAPERPIICVIGDGGFQLNIQELQTLKHYGAKVKTFILNNHCYGITQAFQDTHYAGRHEASGPTGYTVPDFRAVANAYGIAAYSLNRQDQLDDFIRLTLGHPNAVVASIENPGFHSYEPKIDGWATPIEDMTPRLPRDEFRRNMIGVEPLPGWEEGKYR